MDISSVGEVTVWEFSGQESYFPVYHHFLFSNSQCLTCILFSLEDPFAIQLQQVCFWINFLLARQVADLAPGMTVPISKKNTITEIIFVR